jgi:hypothetical protein
MSDATFDNITVIMMWLVLLEEEIVESRENYHKNKSESENKKKKPQSHVLTNRFFYVNQ